MKKILSKKTAVSENELIKIMNEQSKRLTELKKENENLLLALESYRNKEKEISDTLAYAKKQAEEIISDAKVRHALECERIKIYREKWTRLIQSRDPNAVANSVARTMETLRQSQIDMENMLANDFGEAVDSYLMERDRLKDEPRLDYGRIIDPEPVTKPDCQPKPVLKTGEIDKLAEDELNALLSQLRSKNDTL